MLARYTAWILGLMKVLGIWGPFVIAFADSALLGMPVDFVVATYVYQDRRRLLVYIAMASMGSALGSIPALYRGISRRGEGSAQADFGGTLFENSPFV